MSSTGSGSVIDRVVPRDSPLTPLIGLRVCRSSTVCYPEEITLRTPDPPRFNFFVGRIRRIENVKYLGGKPRGFTFLSTPSRNGRMDAGEFNSPRPSRDRSVGINTRTLVVSVRAGRSTTTRQHPSHRTKGAGFERCRIPRNCRQLLRSKILNPRRNWVHTSVDKRKELTGFTLGSSGSRDFVSRHHGNLRFPYDPEALSLYLCRCWLDRPSRSE